MPLRSPRKSRSEIPGQSCRALPISGPGNECQVRNKSSKDDQRSRALRVTQAALWSVQNCCSATDGAPISPTDGSFWSIIEHPAPSPNIDLARYS